MRSDSASNLLVVSRLARSYRGAGGIRDVSFVAPAGAITGFIGANGAGKSTTIRCLMGLLPPEAGEVRMFGAPATAEARRRVGFLPEERGLFPRDRARDTIAFQGRLKGMGRAAALRRADELLERIGLKPKARERIESLSKGNAQRIQILCAMVHRPEFLILDEPLSGLDPIGQSEVLAMFREFAKAGGGILFSTHAMASAEANCDHLVIISDGRTVFEGTVEDAAGETPPGVFVITSDAEGLQRAAASLGGRAYPTAATMGEAARWRVVLPDNVPTPTFIRALAEFAVPIVSIEPIRAGLEGAFWHLTDRGRSEPRPQQSAVA